MSPNPGTLPYVSRKTRSGREFTGASALVSSMVPDGRPTSAVRAPKEIKDVLSVLLTPQPSLLKRPSSPLADEENADTDSIRPRKKYRCQAKGPRKENRRSTTNMGTHRRSQAKAAKRNEGGHQCTPQDRQATMASSAPIYTRFKYSGVKVQAGGYGGIHLGDGARHFPHGDVLEIISHGYTLVPWDGIKPMPLLDDEGVVFAVFAGRPNEEGYLEGCRELYMALESLGECKFPKECLGHRRGHYPALDSGITHGPGSDTITKAVPDSLHGCLKVLLDSKPLRRVLGFCDGAFNRWAPKLYERYRNTLNLAMSQPEYSNLLKISKKSVFAAHSPNAGSSVVTIPHRDSMNLGHGWCGIVALGSFDDAAGGHLVLHEPRLVVQFPAGSAALIPSASITHSNTKLKVGDKRASITFYTGGGLFRFVDNNFRTLKSMTVGEMEGIRVARDAGGPSGPILFSRFHDLA